VSDFLKNITLSFAVLIICLIVADRSLPLFIPITKATLEWDPLLGLRGRPGVTTTWTREVTRPLTVHLNRYGFHDLERSMHKTPGTFRIISLGDSFVEAYTVALGDNFSQLLGQRLNSDLTQAGGTGPQHIEVCNQGIHGYGLGVYYLYVEYRIDAWSPDLVLLRFFLGNDFVDNYYPLAAPVVPSFGLADHGLRYHPPQQSLSTWVRDHVLAHSSIAGVLRESNFFGRHSALDAVARNNGLVSFGAIHPLSEQQRAEVLAIARLQFHRIKEHLAARHVGLFVLVIPDPIRVQEVVTGRPDNRTDDISPSDRIFLERGLLTILETEGISYEYPLTLFVDQVRRGREMYIQKFGHLSTEGHRQTAWVLESRLRQKIQIHADQDTGKSSAISQSSL
jgi:hypothetical protein